MHGIIDDERVAGVDIQIAASTIRRIKRIRATRPVRPHNPATSGGTVQA